MDETLHVNKFEDAEIQQFLKVHPKIPNQDNLGPKFKDFYFWTKFYLKKFEGADVKKQQFNSFFGFQPKNNQIN